jgi:hypothetical protein
MKSVLLKKRSAVGYQKNTPKTSVNLRPAGGSLAVELGILPQSVMHDGPSG